MKRYITIIFAVICMAVSSCTKNVGPSEEDGQHFSLTITAPGAFTTKAEAAGEDAFNENVINSVYYFFYAKDDVEHAPVINGFFSELGLNGGSKTWSIPVSSSAILGSLFPTGTQECSLFIVANPSSDLVSFLEGTPTLDEIRAKVFSTSLKGTQSSFVMIYDGYATLKSRTAAIAAEINVGLKRLAVKLTINAIIAPSYFDANTSHTWTPEVNSINVTFSNALKKTNLSGNYSLLNETYGVVTDADYFETDVIEFNDLGKSGGSYVSNFDYTDGGNTVHGYKVKTTVPIYTYAMKWEFADKYEPYMLFELPWFDTSTQQYKSCYYKLMLSTKQLLSNQWVDVTAKLKALGSFNKVEPVEQYLYEDYMVLGWHDAFDTTPGGSNFNVDAEIKEARYLAVTNNTFTLDDQTRLSIPFSTSHACEYVVVSAKKKNLTSNTDVDVDASDVFSINGSVLEFNHNLNNTIGASLDCTPYTYVVRLQHADNSSFNEVITITQYPALSITAQRNSSAINSSSEKGYVFVNNQQTSSNNAQYYGGVNVLASESGENNNPNMYIIKTNALSGSDMVLSDSRQLEINNLDTWSSAACATANALYDNSSTRRLKYYYPTGKTDEFKKYISPEFRIASSHGKTYSLSQANAERRCASYQEDGYPAGRWRVPTEAEIKYVVQLSTYGLIPSLFTVGSEYWCSTGIVTPKSGGGVDVSTSNNSEAVRCVYDDWYWNVIDKQNGWTDRSTIKTSFVWGDMPR